MSDDSHGKVPAAWYSANCRTCGRLHALLQATHKTYPHYHCAPVASFGDLTARLLIVGLAPGLHGANATGRPFSGDQSGDLLFANLHQYGFANQATAHHRDDGLLLHDCRITNAVKCLPPKNLPKALEIRNCSKYLAAELTQNNLRVVVALGGLAHKAVLQCLAQPLREYAFAHAAEHVLPSGLILLDSYHCSRYNLNTKRLTPDMFAAVFERANALLDNHCTTKSQEELA